MAFVDVPGPRPEIVEDGVVEPVELEPVARTAHEPEEPAEREPVATASVTLASAYVLRGLNVFGATQTTSAALVAPSIELDLGHGLRAGWWGGFQATGSNRGQVVAAAAGHEQDLFVAYETELTDHVAIEAGLTGVAYPFAQTKHGASGMAWGLEPHAAVSGTFGPTFTLEVAHSQTFGPWPRTATRGPRSPWTTTCTSPPTWRWCSARRPAPSGSSTRSRSRTTASTPTCRGASTPRSGGSRSPRSVT